jgi:Kef-type K+ transport system membrane component KefB
MRYLLYPGIPLLAIAAELSAPNSVFAYLMWWIVAIVFSAGTLFLIAYLLVRFIKHLP